jgi:hypothetical protein
MAAHTYPVLRDDGKLRIVCVDGNETKHGGINRSALVLKLRGKRTEIRAAVSLAPTTPTGAMQCPNPFP